MTCIKVDMEDLEDLINLATVVCMLLTVVSLHNVNLSLTIRYLMALTCNC